MILLTALPRTGKSTAIKKIVQMLGVKNCGGFYKENGTCSHIISSINLNLFDNKNINKIK